MSLVPVVRNMILCTTWGADPLSPWHVNLYGLLTRITPIGNPPYPFVIPTLCVYLVLTEARGRGTVKVRVVWEETGHTVFHTKPRSFFFGTDPLAIQRYGLRLGQCRFPGPGNYAFQFWYNDVKAAERLLRLG